MINRNRSDRFKPTNRKFMMKKSLLLLALFVASIAGAQEVVPREDALKASFALWYSVGKVDDLPLKVDADIKYPYGVAKHDLGMIVIPETKLADVISKAGETVLPLGQLWMKGLAPAFDGATVPSSQLKLVDVTVKDETAGVVLCTLGVRKTEKSGLELVIYGKGKEPLKAVALKVAKGKQELPIELTVVPGNESADVTVKVLGKYEATLTVTKKD